jgi:hypothetical protein
MSSITLDRIRTDSPRVDTSAPATRRSFLGRVFDRLIEARQRKAMEEIRRYHRFMLPPELQDAGWKGPGRSEDSLPFGRC